MSDNRTYKDRRDYLISAVTKRRKALRKKAVDHKGGSRESCGYNKCIDALEFHHLNSGNKDFGISMKGYTRSWKIVEAELAKCIMLCANCHRELHANGSFSSKDELKNRVNSGKPKVK